MIHTIKRSSIFVFFVLLLVVCLLSASLVAAEEESGNSGENYGGDGTEKISDDDPGEEGVPGDNPAENPDEETGAEQEEPGASEEGEHSSDDVSSPGIEGGGPNLELKTLESEGYYFPCDSSKSGFTYDDSDPIQLECAGCHAFHQGISEHLLRP